ncbi:hypothetical protein AAEP80_17135 [Curtobacterium sp. L3-7]|uniref:hypothetical protein n=1 Tax=Curtobacterium sp. L3-7 TaxID=3138787 RepID=UPI003B52D7A0
MTDVPSMLHRGDTVMSVFQECGSIRLPQHRSEHPVRDVEFAVEGTGDRSTKAAFDTTYGYLAVTKSTASTPRP